MAGEEVGGEAVMAHGVLPSGWGETTTALAAFKATDRHGRAGPHPGLRPGPERQRRTAGRRLVYSARRTDAPGARDRAGLASDGPVRDRRSGERSRRPAVAASRPGRGRIVALQKALPAVLLSPPTGQATSHRRKGLCARRS